MSWTIRRARSGRAAAALMVVGTSALVGLGLGVNASPSAAADPTEPSGGCWAYQPGTPPVDVSTSLEDWTSAPGGGVQLASSGSTAVGANRHVDVTITDGPVLSASDFTGEASFVVSVDGTSLPAFTKAVSVTGGDGVDGLTAGTDFAIDGAGSHEIKLVGITFDNTAGTLRVVCNGQGSGVATPGNNPATRPRPTDLTTSFSAVAKAKVSIDEVTNQAVTNAARPADEITLDAVGLTSRGAAAVQFCNASAACVTLAGATLGANGGGTATFTMPAMPAGAGTLRVDDGTTQASTPFTILGVQSMSASEKLGTSSTTITFAGTGWDPTRDVVIQGYAGKASSSARTDDAAVTVRADATGAFTASYAVTDKDTVSVIADQTRSSTHIGSVYLVSGVIGSGATDEEGGGTTDTGGDSTDTGTTSSGGSSGSTGNGGVTTTPDTIPVPTPTPTTPGGTVAPGALEVSDIRLDGQDSIASLFGGAPARTLRFVLTNTGNAPAVAPMIRAAIGRSADVTPMPITAATGTIPAGGQVIVSVPVELPPAAVGTYHVVVQVGDDESGSFDVPWTSYPWGLLALDAIGLALLIIGVGSQVAQRRAPATAAAPATVPTAPLAPADADAIVDLEAAERWWAGNGSKSGSRAS